MIVTDEAIEKLKQILAEQDAPGIGVRIYTSSGCCGPNLHMSIVDQVETGDIVVSIKNLDFIIEAGAKELVNDLVVDFSFEKFRFLNKKPKKGCC